MPDMLNVQMNERVDLEDFSQLAQSPDEHARNAASNFFLPVTGQKCWVLSGFTSQNPTAAQLRVTKGSAFLTTKVGGEVQTGFIIGADGDATKTLDLASYPDGTYYAYVRFEYQEGDIASRVFWNASGSGSEFAQLTNTRKLANWNLRVEASTPGSEWMRVSQVVKSGGALAISDLRELYFEGTVASNYASTWTNRVSDRATYGVTNLKDFIEVARAKYQDFTGGSAAGHRWWEDPGYGILDTLRIGAISTGFVTWGFTLDIPGGLDAGIGEGEAWVRGIFTYWGGDYRTFTANRDTYVDLNYLGALTYTEVANGAAAPPLAGNAIRLFCIVTDGSDIPETRQLYSPGLTLDSSSRQLTLNAVSGETPTLMFKKAMGPEGQPQFSTAGTIQGAILFHQYDGYSYGQGAAIRAQAAATHTAGNIPTMLVFCTAETNWEAERLRLTHQGDLWLGLAAASTVRYKLGIGQNANQRGLAVLSGAANSPAVEMSATANSGFIGYNAYLSDDTPSLKYANTLASRGATGFLFNRASYHNRIFVIADYGTSTAGSAFTVEPMAAFWKDIDGGHLIVCDHGSTFLDSPYNMLEVKRTCSVTTDDAYTTLLNTGSSGATGFGEVGLRLKNGSYSTKHAWRTYMPDNIVGDWSLRFNYDDTDILTLVASSGDPKGYFGSNSSSQSIWQVKGNFRLQNGSVAHGMTNVYPTDVPAVLDCYSSTEGGGWLTGLSENIRALGLRGCQTNEDTTDTSASNACVEVYAAKRNGVNLQAISATGNLFAIQNFGTTRLVLKGDGTLHLTNTTLVALDDYEDALACRDAAYAQVNPKMVVKYDLKKLQQMGVMAGNFINYQGMQALVLGGIGELYHVLDYLLKKLGMDYDAIRREVRGLN